jgi:hypothetical protein
VGEVQKGCVARGEMVVQDGLARQRVVVRAWLLALNPFCHHSLELDIIMARVILPTDFIILPTFVILPTHVIRYVIYC